MTKTNSSGFASLAIVVVIAVAVVVAGVYFVVSGRNDNQQITSNTNADSASQTDADKPLDAAAGNITDDIEKQVNSLTDDDYSDSGLSDTALYE